MVFFLLLSDCPEDRYGVRCEQTCMCDNGNCSRATGCVCEEGWTGLRCNIGEYEGGVTDRLTFRHGRYFK